MGVPWEIRLFAWQVAAVFIFVGWTWMKGWPRYRSIWGLQLKKAMESEEAWRALHRRFGKLLLVLGIWTALPFPSVATMLFLQLPVLIIVPPCVLIVLKRSLEK